VSHSRGTPGLATLSPFPDRGRD